MGEERGSKLRVLEKDSGQAGPCARCDWRPCVPVASMVRGWTYYGQSGRGTASALSLSAITAPTQAIAGTSSAERPGEARGENGPAPTKHSGSTWRLVLVLSSIRRLERCRYLHTPIAPSSGCWDGPVPTVRCGKGPLRPARREYQYKQDGEAWYLASASAEPTPGRPGLQSPIHNLA